MVGEDCSVVASCPWLLIHFILMLDFTLLLPSVDGALSESEQILCASPCPASGSSVLIWL